jgi:murein DD-endopeptidase MepM/ murein hydrolase activator NlpD
MMRLKHSTRGGASFPPSFRHGAVALLAVLAGGCSAEITRFDFPGFSLTDDKKETTTASLQEPNGGSRGPSYLGNEGRYGSAGNDRGYTAPRSNNDGNVAMAPLSEPQGGYGDDRRPGAQPQPSYRAAPPRQGEAVDVQPGDTLYALSRRHHVSVAELMDVNNLSNPNLHPGQKIYLPAGYPAQAAGYPAQAAGYPASSAPTVQARQVATVAVPPSGVSPAVKAKYDGSYTVRDGESVYSIAKSVGVPVAELQRVNGITDARTVRSGTVLRVPGAGASSAVAEAAPQPRTQVAVVPPAMDSDLTAQPAAPAASPRSPTVINRRNEISTSGTEVATGAITPPAVQPRAAAGDNKLRWPVQGKILAAFGQRDDGTHNDGINLSVPQGTAVHAADAGTVAYAGSELKGYGNLVLVRHDNGWVTAYAHNDALLVKRGDKVQRGQVIAKAGRTGSVDQPQLHFELRQGSKPVDPVPFLERL